MRVGEKVSHDANIDTTVVFGHVVDHDESEQKTQVKWADGSGPTWHLTRTLRTLEPGDPS